MAMLAEPRRRHRIGPNPRGKFFTEDEDNKGKNLLEKMGWTKGAGLGVSRQGIKEPIKPKIQTDSKGLGFDVKSDPWMSHCVDFNSLLQNLQAVHGNENKVVNQNQSFNAEADPQKTHMHLEEKSKTSRSRIHYHKFIKNKDLSHIDTNDWSCILGKQSKLTEEPETGEDEASFISRVDADPWEKDDNTDPNNLNQDNIAQSEENSEMFINKGSLVEYFKAQRAKYFQKSTLPEDQTNGNEIPDCDNLPLENDSQKKKKRKRKERELIQNEKDEFTDGSKGNPIFNDISNSALSDSPGPTETEDISCNIKKKKKKKHREVQEENLMVAEENVYEVKKKLKRKKKDKKTLEGEGESETISGDCNYIMKIKEEQSNLEETLECVVSKKHKKKRKRYLSNNDSSSDAQHSNSNITCLERNDMCSIDIKVEPEELSSKISENMDELNSNCEKVKRKSSSKKKKKKHKDLDADAEATNQQNYDHHQEQGDARNSLDENISNNNQNYNDNFIPSGSTIANNYDNSIPIPAKKSRRSRELLSMEELNQVAKKFKGSNFLQIAGYGG